MGSAGSAAAAQYIDETGTNSILAYFAFTGMYVFSSAQALRICQLTERHPRNLLGQAANAIVFPPLSETFGRKQQFVWGSLVFAISCGLTVIPTFTMVQYPLIPVQNRIFFSERQPRHCKSVREEQSGLGHPKADQR